MSGKHFVCQGAICSCKFGTSPDKMVVKTQTKLYINDKEGTDKLIVTNKEIGQCFEKNSFGSCAQLRNNPCQVIITEWTGFFDKINLKENNGYVLLEDSKASCPIGGKNCIIINHHGQTAEVTQNNVDNSDAEVLMELFPFVEWNESIINKMICHE